MPPATASADQGRVSHEAMTAVLIRESEIAHVLRDQFAHVAKHNVVEEVIAVATSPVRAKLEVKDLPWYQFLNDILAGELGGDRVDYLLRDSWHSGQSAGQFDWRKLINSMIIVEPPRQEEDAYRLGIDDGGWLVAEQMVAARYLMYVALYFHKTKRIYELHLEDFLAKWLPTRFGRPHLPADEWKEYAALTDSTIWAAIYEASQNGEGKLRELAKPFVGRTHLRLAREVLLADNHSIASRGAMRGFARTLTSKLEDARPKAGQVEVIMACCDEALGELMTKRHPRNWNGERFDKLVESTNNIVREKFGTKADVRTDVTAHSAAKFFGEPNKIWVSLNGKTRYLDDLSEIVNGMPSKIWRGRIYASADHRDEVRAYCDRWLGDDSEQGGEPDAHADGQ